MPPRLGSTGVIADPRVGSSGGPIRHRSKQPGGRGRVSIANGPGGVPPCRRKELGIRSRISARTASDGVCGSVELTPRATVAAIAVPSLPPAWMMPGGGRSVVMAFRTPARPPIQPAKTNNESKVPAIDHAGLGDRTPASPSPTPTMAARPTVGIPRSPITTAARPLRTSVGS